MGNTVKFEAEKLCDRGCVDDGEKDSKRSLEAYGALVRHLRDGGTLQRLKHGAGREWQYAEEWTGPDAAWTLAFEAFRLPEAKLGPFFATRIKPPVFEVISAVIQPVTFAQHGVGIKKQVLCKSVLVTITQTSDGKFVSGTVQEYKQ